MIDPEKWLREDEMPSKNRELPVCAFLRQRLAEARFMLAEEMKKNERLEAGK